MGIAIHLETYAFNYSFADNFVIFNYWIKNVSKGDLDSVFVSMYGDLVVRNTNITPPTSGTPFYNKGGVNYVDSLNLAYAYDYIGDGGEADTYGAFKFLGSTPHKTKTTYQTWQFGNTSEPTYFYPSTDPDKYTKMATGLLPVQIQAVLQPSNYMTQTICLPSFCPHDICIGISVLYRVFVSDVKSQVPVSAGSGK